MRNYWQRFQALYCVFSLFLAAGIGNASACTISEDMVSSLPPNSREIPNVDRVKIAKMMATAKQWPNAEIGGIVYTGGYIKERNPRAVAAARASELRSYLVQLGVGETNIWIDTRIITEPDVDDRGNATLNQIAVSLVPICEGGCERLCNDPLVTPNTEAIR
ncbi:hypothetical protein [Paraburkholderia mimosarum]|uniref:hypothetical protein n=1 Tax=Paraburkholderia mimosarum TaxID=312026 RepID=UPI0012B5C9AA|nr:hypothetical protein [Paraburkholderia mimosarum]